MELGHTEAIKQAVMAGLGVAFLSTLAIRVEVETGRLFALRLRGHRVRRHFHVIHNEARTLGASARAFVKLIERASSSDRAGTARRTTRVALGASS